MNTNRKQKVNSGPLDITPTRNSKFNPSITRINAIIHLGVSHSIQPAGQNCSSIKCGGCLCCYPPWSLPQRSRFVFLPFVRQFFLSFPCSNSFSIPKQVTFTLGGLGEITGDTVQTKTYANAPHSNRPYYRFRNVPYAQPFQR